MSDTGSGNEYGHSERRGGGGSDGDPHKTEGKYFVRLPGRHINPVQFAFYYQPQSGMVIRWVELGILGLFGPVGLLED